MLWRKPGTPSRKADNSKVKDDATRDNSEEHSLSARELRISCPAWATSASESSSSNVFTELQTIVAAVVLTAGTLVTLRIYKNYFKRVPEATKIKEAWLGKRSIFGRVTSVGDGDNFRLFHTPGGRLTGWGWLRRVPVKKAALRSNTIHVRLAGIDAPELSHFGKPAQPYGQEALDWLTSYVNGRRVRAYVHKADQYQRVVGTAYVWKGFLRRDVGLQMLRAGLATVYEAKSGAVFGKGLEQKYRDAEAWAKGKKKGIWAAENKNFESPREYKTKHGTGAPAEGEQPKKRGWFS